MTTKLHDMLIDEIAFIFDTLEHESVSELEKLDSLAEASAQSEGYIASFGEDLPEGLRDPETMMIVWNYVVEQKKDMLEQKRIEEEDNRTAAMHPDWLCFPGVYSTGKAKAACFFDLENLLADMKTYLCYDKEHCEIVRKAMMAYAGQN